MSLLCNSMDMTGITVHSQLEESPKAEMTAAEGCAHTGNQVGLLTRVMIVIIFVLGINNLQ